MKVIDLLNKIANGEEIPNKFVYIDEDDCRYIFEKETDNDYWCEELGNHFFSNYCVQLILNDVIIIIEDRCECIDKEVEKLFEEDKEIEKLERVNGSYLVDLQSNSPIAHQNEAITSLIMYLNKNADKINELVKAVNELKKGK